MNHPIVCKIEHLTLQNEQALILSLKSDVVADAAILLAGLLYSKTNKIKFTNHDHTVELRTISDRYVLSIDGVTVAVTRIWLEAVLGMLLDVCLKGWTITSHLDQDFETITVSVAILPPKQ